MRMRLVLGSILLSACFSEPVQEADTDVAVVGVCRQCQQQECQAYADACKGDPECDACVEAPFGLACLANTNMHKLGSCSCDNCGSDCDYLCPGATGACTVCGMQECQAESTACLGDPECGACFDDPYRAGCDTNMLFMMAQACLCPACGQACIWECPMAGNTCAMCMSTMCADPLGACMQDDTCNNCFSSPYLEECADNMLHDTFMTCLCGNCSEDCGVLFDCAAG